MGKSSTNRVKQFCTKLTSNRDLSTAEPGCFCEGIQLLLYEYNYS